MKVSELIEALQKFPQNADVVAFDNQGDWWEPHPRLESSQDHPDGLVSL